MNSSTMFWGFLFGTIGFGYFLYGKKQGSMSPLAAGLALMISPYFVSNTILLVVIGLALLAMPFFIKF